MSKKKKLFSFEGFDQSHYQTTEAYAKAIDSIYSKAVDDFSRMASRLNIDTSKPFSFDDYPAAKKESQRITNELAGNIQAVISDGIRRQWLYANQKNDDFIASILDTSKISEKRLKKYQDRNLDALSAFQSRKTDGLGLSDRVWKYAGKFKDQMELGIDIGLGDGRSAQLLSQDLRKYLVDPDKLFRRVRDKYGNLQLSKNAKAYHPGQGKYRSSYKNAMRLTRTEVNMAYRESDYLRWLQLDFVSGYEVKLSNRHSYLDICDTLAGKSSKTFKFVGWHPQCMCHVIPVLMPMDEFFADAEAELRAAINGSEYEKYSASNVVTDVPKSFKDWVEQNAEASKGWKSVPYFVRDNFEGGNLGGSVKIAEKTIKPVYERQPINTADDVVSEINRVGSEWFCRGFKNLSVEKKIGNNGSTDMDGNIWLKRKRLENVINSLEKIRTGKEIEFDEADSMATLWHEITHNRNKIGYVDMTKLQRQSMELANEFVARNTLPEFYSALSADKTPFTEFMMTRTSTAYNGMVVNYDKLISILDLDKQNVLNVVREYLYDHSYIEQTEGLVQGLLKYKPKGPDGVKLNKTQIKSMVKICKMYNTDSFEEMIKRELSK